ncbi:hypothetical protein [Mesonia sp. HuA40]|uniref:hypothetical protein n=1 Tax=Mesonia sp. HuA40 TaxID=2602761 RepID=UPI0011C95F6D|nr:hypothetical protein [Mesonia sp. HuA40]TXK72577.1 hypothetical protein FT993_07020 [Mesonia sp. HuA40]
MEHFRVIEKKLTQFIRRYYTNELIKGILLFFSIGILYFLGVVFLEYTLWLNPFIRKFLFWIFIGVEAILLFKLVGIPLLQLFRIRQGISYEEASRLIGKHFTEVDDKLLNLLQLQNKLSKEDSKLLIASIEQKAIELKPIPFQQAISFKSSLSYAKWAILPALIFTIIYVTDSLDSFNQSYARVVQYNQEFTPPAPFEFSIDKNQLQHFEKESFTLEVKVHGKFLPESVHLLVKDKKQLLKKIDQNTFTFHFDNLTENLSFKLGANGFYSKTYDLLVRPVPKLIDFKMQLQYPAYLNRLDETINGTGNAKVPEGTNVKWLLKTENTENVGLKTKDTVVSLANDAHLFHFNKRNIKAALSYEVFTSNAFIEAYERMNYKIEVVKDELPRIKMQRQIDSLETDIWYFKGSIQDDHGLTQLALVIYPISQREEIKAIPIAFTGENFAEFYYDFPNGLDLTPGTAYQFYFEVKDNDEVNGFKRARSEVYNYRVQSDKEKEKQSLTEQKQAISGMSESLNEMQKQQVNLNNLKDDQREKAQLSYQDKQRLKDLAEREKQQNEMMEKFAKSLEKELNKNEKNSLLKEALKERLNEVNKDREKDDKLLKELEKYQDKIRKDRLDEKMEKLGQNNLTQQKKLAELLELTKRFYVEQKAEQLAADLKELADKQNELSYKKEENTGERQEELNVEFEEWQKNIDQLHKENKALIKPLKLERSEVLERSIKKDQEEAKNILEEQKENKENQEQSQQNSNQSKAQKKQREAAQKMQRMGQKMQQMMQSGAQEQMQEDAAMLERLLHNLLRFSFSQEELIQQSEEFNVQNALLKGIRTQQKLKENFKHIDDSLFALASRNPMISPKIDEVITSINSNIDIALSRLAENEVNYATANQQYVFKGANDLANMLAQSLDQMQSAMQMMGQGKSGQGKPKPGQGKGQDGEFQLETIIKKQGELGNKEGNKPGSKQIGKQGQNGQEGQKGEQEGAGAQGESGQSNTKQGKDGKSGIMGDSEEMSKEIFEIYKQQQALRFQLQDVLESFNMGKETNQLLRKMQEVEKKILTQGYTEETGKRMRDIQHQLIQIKGALLEQEQENRRTAKTNKKEFVNDQSRLPLKAKEYFQMDDILNRQSLPLQPKYEEKVRTYFKNTNDSF